MKAKEAMKMEIITNFLSLINGFLYEPSLLSQMLVWLRYLLYLISGLISVWLYTYVREDAKESIKLVYEQKRESIKKEKGLRNKKSRGRKHKNSHSSAQEYKKLNTYVVRMPEIKPQLH